MPLLEIWKATRESVIKMNSEAIVRISGDGQLKDGSEASREFRQFMPELFAKKPEDNIKQRDKALVLMQRQFSVILADASLERGPNNEARTLYSLRHTCIMFRLLYGEGMDLLTLARNARTSTEMIDRFYASHLEGEQNIEMIQSRRKRKTTTTEEQIENAIAALTDEKLTAILEQRLQSKKDIVVAEASVTKPKARKIKRAKTDDMDN